MNVFFRELKASWKGIIFWSIGTIILVWSGLVKYATINTTGQSITDLMKQFPRSVQVIFGISDFDLTKISGFFGVTFMYIALLATIHAILLGSGIIAKEERDKTSEFLLTKPTSRSKVITAKIFAGLVMLLIMNIVITISSLFFVNLYSNGESIVSEILLLMTGLLCLQLIFFFIGTAVASVVKKAKAASSIATGVLLFTFILTFLINMDERLDVFHYLTPFKYFDAKTIMADGHLSVFYLILAGVLVFASILLTYRAYQAKDLND
jgi:ABC-2 type transport system permease protein